MPQLDKKVEKAIFIAKKNLAGLVYDFQTIEGMPFTLPEVQTYLQGITIGGHKETDECKLKRQAEAWKYLINLVENEKFKMTKGIACTLQSIVAKEEALEWGDFRHGQVWIKGSSYIPPEHTLLDQMFDNLCERINNIKDVFTRGLVVSLDMARSQYFYDGNKRTGLLMTNGMFMSNGLMPFSIPSKAVLEYNTKMLKFYETGKEKPLLNFFEKQYIKEYPGFDLNRAGL